MVIKLDVFLKNQLLKLFYEANSNFLKNHMKNIVDNVSERNLCAQLSMEINLLKKKYGFDNYYSDPEYDRNGRDCKKTINDEGKPKTIICDLIFHSRGLLQKDNLMAIEMKKNLHNKKGIDDDRGRLKALTDQKCDSWFEFGGNLFPKKVCLYEIGLMYLLDIENKKITYEIYADGRYISKETNTFDEMINYNNSSFKNVKI